MRLDFAAFGYYAKGRFWRALWTEINEDNCWGLAAQLSYYFLLAFFPFLIFLSALVGFLPIEADLVNRFVRELELFLPSGSSRLVSDILSSLLASQNKGVLTVGILITLWSASMGINGLVGVLNHAYTVRETRSYLKTRSLAIFVTVIVSLFLILGGALLFFGDWLIELLFEREWVKFCYGLLRWMLIFLFLNVGVQIVYFALPARRLPWKMISPGSVFATLGGIIGSLAFRHYVNHFGDFQRLYGGLGALIALMVWFYLCSFFLLLGGEIDSEIFKFRQAEKTEPTRRRKKGRRGRARLE